MDPRLADLLRNLLMVIILVVVGLFGFKQYRRHADRSALVSQMQTDVGDPAFYHAFRQEEAQATLLRCIGRIHRANRLGMEPGVFFDRVFDRTQTKASSEEEDAYPSKEKLVRDTLERAYQHATQLGLLEDKTSLQDLEAGEMPSVTPKPVIGTIIDPSLSPGLEKIVPNLDLRPANLNRSETPTDLEIAAVRKLAQQLSDARVIDDAASRRILAAYDAAKTPPKPAPAPAPGG